MHSTLGFIARHWLPQNFAPKLIAALVLGWALGACSNSGGGDGASAVDGGASQAAVLPPAMQSPPPAMPAVLDDVEQRAFNYFWETTNVENGLVTDRWPNPPFSSIAAIGFALTAYPVGVERGYITREQARNRTLTTMRFFRDAPQGPQTTGMTGYKGFFYHFLDMKTGARYRNTELSTVDTSLLLAGMLFAQSYFDGSDAQESEIRSAVDAIAGRVDWAWAQKSHPPYVSMGWLPESGDLPYDWNTYNESTLVVLMGMASPTHPLPASAWSDLSANFNKVWSRTQGFDYISFPPLFGHQFTHVWIDFRGIQDPYIQSKGIDYFENSRRATYAQQHYAIANPAQCKGYDANIWGLSASDGPGAMTRMDYSGKSRDFRDYFARGVGVPQPFDDCTIAPSAAISSLPFAPELVIPTVQAMQQRYGDVLYGQYGFVEAFNPSFVDATAKLAGGRVLPNVGWVDTDYVGIDQGPIVAMLENYRTGLVWRTMAKNPNLRRALRNAGFSGGWLNS